MLPAPLRPLAAAALVALTSAAVARAEIGADLVKRLKPMVVNVERSAVVGLSDDSPGRSRASAFVVDAERGILATNQHVSGLSPARFKIVFENGQSAEARILHHDVWHDFAFLKVDPKGVAFKLQAVELGSSLDLKEQQDVVMIGNNDAQEYSVKFGKVSNLVIDKGDRHSATLQTTFDRAGGSSGSPVFDAKGRVVAIHFAGTDTTSFELRIEYLKDALRQLQAGQPVKRGEAGLDVRLTLVSDAVKHFHLSDALADKVRALRAGLKYVIAVESRVPGTKAEELLMPGDVVLTLDGQWLGDDLYKLDRLVDAKTGGEIEATVVRNGAERTVRLTVADAEALKLKRFARFGGGVVQDLTPEVRLRNNFTNAGVFLAQAENGSSMAQLGNEVGRGSQRYLTVIEGVNAVMTPDLGAFIRVVRELKDRDDVYFLVRDNHSHNTAVRAIPVKLDLRFSPLDVASWDPAALEWVPEKSTP